MIIAVLFLSINGALMLWRLITISRMYITVWSFERNLNKLAQNADPGAKKIKVNPIPLHKMFIALITVVAYWMSVLVLTKEALI